MIIEAWLASDPHNNIFLSGGSFMDMLANMNNSKDPVNMGLLEAR